MALRIAALILVFSILSSLATANDTPKCKIPDGHKNGEIVGRYDPEPHSGAVCKNQGRTFRIIRTCRPRYCCKNESCTCESRNLRNSYISGCENTKLECFVEARVEVPIDICCHGSRMLSGSRRCQMIGECVENTPGCECTVDGKNCTCLSGYQLHPNTSLCDTITSTKPTPPRPIRAHSTSESESSTPLVFPRPESVETAVFPYPYIAAGSLAALLLLLLLCLLLFLLLRRCRRRRRSQPAKFDAEAFANALYDKGGLPPPAYVVADIDEEKTEKMKKEKIIDYDDIDKEKKGHKKGKMEDHDDVVEENRRNTKKGELEGEEKNKKTKKDKKSDGQKNSKKKTKKMEDVDEEKTGEVGGEDKNNFYGSEPSVSKFSTKSEKTGIVVGNAVKSLPGTRAHPRLPPTPPPSTISSLTSSTGRRLTVSDNTNDYAEIVETDP